MLRNSWLCLHLQNEFKTTLNRWKEKGDETTQHVGYSPASSWLTLGYGRPLLVLKAGSRRCPSSLAMCRSSSWYHNMRSPRFFSMMAMEWPPSRPLKTHNKRTTQDQTVRHHMLKMDSLARPEVNESFSHPRTRMLVSNTDTTMSLSSFTSDKTRRTAASNSTVLFNTWGWREDEDAYHV